MPSRRLLTPLFFAAIFVQFAVTTAHSQPKPGYAPSSTHVYPAGARRGTSVDVSIGGECLPPGARLTVFGPGVRVGRAKAPSTSKGSVSRSSTARLTRRIEESGEPSPRRKPTEEPITYPKEWASRIAVDKSAKPGVVRWRLSCAQGGTATRPFVIGDLPEFLETEPNSTFEHANSVALPVTVNGRIYGERDLDHFRFAAKPGDVVVCDVLASRLQSRLDPVVTILDADGQPVATETIYVEDDSVIAFRASTAGDYVLRIGNVSHRGDSAHVYRINISTQPFTRSAFPTGGVAGTTQTVEFRVMTGTDTPLIVKRRIPIPAEIPADGRLRYRLQHAGSAAANTVGFDVVPRGFRMSAAAALKLPIRIERRLSTPDDQHRFKFQARKGVRYSIVCDTGLGSKAFPTLLLSDASGKRIAFSRSIEADDRSCRVAWRAPADGTVEIRVRDQQFGAAGGAEFTYRLTVREPEPDYQLSVASDSTIVLQGGELRLSVSINRQGGFAEPFTVAVEGLPAGVTAKPATVKGNSKQVTIRITASKDAKSGGATLRIVGRTKQGKVRTARLKINGSVSRTRDAVHLTVAHKPVFRLFCSEAYLYAHRGSVFMYPMEIERLDGFDGKITLQIGDRQNRDLDGIQMFEVATAPGKSEIALPIYLPETMHINIQSQSQLYSQAYATFTDKHGRKQSVLVLSEKRNMLRTLPPVVKLKSVDESVTVKAGATAHCRLKLERTSNFPGAMKVELLASKGGPAFTTGRARFEVRKNDVTVDVRVPKTARGTVPLRFRATGTMTDGTTIITESVVELRIK